MTLRVIQCVGAPRDLGLVQGKAFGEAIQQRVERAGIGSWSRDWVGLRPFASGPVLGRGAGREIVRHYPHLAERMAGLARGAGVPIDALMALFVASSGPDDSDRADDFLTAPAVAVAAAGASGDRVGALARSLAALEERASEWVVRRSHPEHGFGSIEVTLPWLATAVAGVNEAGLAVAIAPDAGASSPATARAAGMVLLVQECLQRFAELEAAVEWCVKRPVSGHGSLVLADRTGRRTAVCIRGVERRVVPAGDGVAVAGASVEQEARLRDLCKENDGLSPDALAHFGSAGQRVWLEVREARLTLFDGARQTLSATPF